MFLLSLSESAREPLWQQISTQIHARIAAGRLRPGDELPAYGTLARQERVSRSTVSRAYEALEAAGFISSRGQRFVVSCRNAPGQGGDDGAA